MFFFSPFFRRLTLCLGLFVAWPMPGTTATLDTDTSFSLNAFMVETTGNDVKVESELHITNGNAIRDQLRSGAQMVLACTASLVRVRTVMSNESLAEIAFSAQLRHDPLIREFILYQEGKPLFRSKKLDELLSTFWKNETIVLPLARPLESGETYRISLQLTLQHSKVPPWLEKALFFWSWDVTPPLAVTQEFVF